MFTVGVNKAPAVNIAFPMNDEAMRALGRIEAKLDIALQAKSDHEKRLTKIERTNNYQAGFLAACSIAIGAAWKMLLKH